MCGDDDMDSDGGRGGFSYNDGGGSSYGDKIYKGKGKEEAKKKRKTEKEIRGKGKEEATITYDDPPTASSAINWIGGKVIQDTVFVSGLSEAVNEDELSDYFGAIGVIKLDKKTGEQRIWIYKDKMTGKGKGEATITYDDPSAASSAINWFGGKDFQGKKINVQLAQRKTLSGGGLGRGGREGGGGGALVVAAEEEVVAVKKEDMVAAGEEDVEVVAVKKKVMVAVKNEDMVVEMMGCPEGDRGGSGCSGRKGDWKCMKSSGSR